MGEIYDLLLRAMKTKAAILSDDCFLSMVETDGIEPLTS